MRRALAAALLVAFAACGPKAPPQPSFHEVRADGQPVPWERGQRIFYRVNRGPDVSLEVKSVENGLVRLRRDLLDPNRRIQAFCTVLHAPAATSDAPPADREVRARARARITRRGGDPLVGSFPLSLQFVDDVLLGAGVAALKAAKLLHEFNTGDRIGGPDAQQRYFSEEDAVAILIQLSARRVLEKTHGNSSLAREDVTVPAGTFPMALRYDLELDLFEGTRKATVWAHSAAPITGAVKIELDDVRIELAEITDPSR